MLNEKVEKALNDQLNAESFSAYLYLSMSSYFESLNMKGFATWMRVQAEEEYVHAKKFYDFILQRGGRIRLKGFEDPQTDWDSPEDAFAGSLHHEEYITSRINSLMNIAIEEKDHATQIFLQWFVTEQVEEEDNVGSVLSQIRMMGETKNGLYMLDRELGQRSLEEPDSE
ncbi:MAG: ferritin [Deltaproteobacteria bacterium]|nr:MAG: ferritin [Deltaproteobacteria bacterium]